MALTPIPAYPNNGTVPVSPAGGFPTTIAASGNWQSNLLPAGFGGVAAAVLSTQAGTITIQRYADKAGLVPIGALLTTTLVANTANWVSDAADRLPFVSFNVTINNTGGSPATISNCAILTGPASR